MRIVVEGTTLRPGRTGVGYYVEHLLTHLAIEAPDVEVVVASNGPVETVRALPRGVRVADGYAFPLRLPWMQMVAPRLVDEVGADLVHFTNSVVSLASPVPTVVTIHDMSLTLYPHFHPVRRVLLQRPFVALAVHRADTIITVSHSARRDILRHYRVPPERVRVVYEAAAPAFRPVADRESLASVARRYRLPARFVLYVGTIEPRKNLPRLLEAFARRKRAGDLPHALVCAGRYGWRARDVRRTVERLDVGDAVRFLGYVPFGDLPALYNLAEIFVFPSLHEGFGLPVLEAMACGTPAVVGRNSSLVEVAGDAAEAVDAVDTEAIGDAIVRLAHDPDARRERARLGLARARAFSWRRAARETLEIYRAVAAGALAAPAIAASGSGQLVFSERHARPLAAGAEPPAHWS